MKNYVLLENLYSISVYYLFDVDDVRKMLAQIEAFKDSENCSYEIHYFATMQEMAEYCSHLDI